MKLGRLGNKKLRKLGTESSEQVTDQLVHQVLLEMRNELQVIRTILAQMADLELEDKDIGEFYDN